MITDNPSLSGDKDIFFYEPFDWNNIISLFNEKSLVLSTNNVDATFNQFKSYYKLIEAAGGLIVNPKSQWLMIYRLGRWDLPKGKIDEGETPLQTAVREIKEECNITINPKHCNFLDHTFHVYTLKNTPILKKTHWFLCLYKKENDIIIPQTEENIEKVEWISQEKWNELKHLSYPSIVQIINKYHNKK